MPVVTHLVSLRQPAGVEAHFGEFVRCARRSEPTFAHGWLDAAGGMHPLVAANVAGELAHVIDAKRRSGVRLPSRPAALRTWHCRRALSAAGTDVLVVWNRTAKARFALDAMGDGRCIHWEHGAAWDAGREAERREYLRRVPYAIANSTAAARVLQLRWDYRGELRVCVNALRPSLVPAAARRKRFPTGKITLGVAARLYPVKGVALALHALALLRRSLDVELAVAGEGPERPRLAALAARLGIAEHVHFRGAVADMAGFYASIACLLHAPITEAFGLVALEAAAHGCPVVVAGVDGLGEAVTAGVAGRAVAPSLRIATYVELGGAAAGLPEIVYDPVRDALAEPRAVDPDLLAAAVAGVLADADGYEKMSAAASAAAPARPDFVAHVRDVMAVIASCARSGRARSAVVAESRA
jgi:glycosyltransferase involved in cell wall biosynthesis